VSEILAYLNNLRDPSNLLDIALVALIIFGVLRLFQGTQAMQLVRGVVLVVLVTLVLSQTFDLIAFNWLLRTASPMLLVAIPVIFQPELRRALERLGRSTPAFLRRGTDNTVSQRIVNEVAQAAEQLARRRTGALIVFEGLTGLGEIIDRGVRLDAEVSAELLVTIFWPNTPLHDGAAILRGEQIVAAGCVLPLATQDLGDPQIGTRHRAAVGVTEQTDAMSLVVSEETGNISVARNGRIVRVEVGQLRKILTEFYRPAGATGPKA
jgi:diadenylate cyclase